MWLLGPRFVGGRDTPDFGHAFSNYTYFPPCGRIWFSSVRRAQGLGCEKRKKEESMVKYKSADNYIWRPNNAVELYSYSIAENILRHCGSVL